MVNEKAPNKETIEKMQLKTRKWESMSRKYPVQPYWWDEIFIIDRFSVSKREIFSPL